jgi:peptide-methionine (S)-S-oxide reductase
MVSMLFGEKSLPSKEQSLAGRSASIDIVATHLITGQPMTPPFQSHLHSAFFAMGCFWGAERRFWEQPGIHATVVGYAGGHTPNPTYEETCSGLTGHTEVVQVIFDSNLTSFENLLTVFWESHDPTQGMRQGNDLGTQYRSAIYCSSQEQLDKAKASVIDVQKKLTVLGLGSVTTEIQIAPTFYYAEDYHQQYLAKNPMAYCGLLPKPLIKVSE